MSGHSLQYVITVTETIFNLHACDSHFSPWVVLNLGREQEHSLSAIRPQQEGTPYQNEAISFNATGIFYIITIE